MVLDHDKGAKLGWLSALSLISPLRCNNASWMGYGGEPAPGVLAFPSDKRADTLSRDTNASAGAADPSPDIASWLPRANRRESLPFPFPCARSTHRTGISGQDTPRDSTKFNPTAGVRWMPKQAPFGSACPLKKIPQFPSTSEGALPPLWRELPWAGSHAGDSALMLCTVASRHFPSPHVPTLRLQEGSHEADCAPHPTTPPSPVQAFCRFGPRHWQPEPAHLSALLRRRMNITFAKQTFSHLSLAKAQARQTCAHCFLGMCYRGVWNLK